MKILVTGCVGFIGSNLVPHLLNLGHEIVGFDNLFNPSIRPTDRMKQASGDNWKNFKFYKVDIRSGPEMQTILLNEKVDAVIHLAAVGSVPRSFLNPLQTVSVNELGFVTLLQVMAVLKIPRLVFASSSSVYGDSLKRVKIEGEEGNPLSPYAISKRANELFASVWCPQVGINYVGLRFFNVYGPGQLVHSDYAAVIPKFINNEPVIYGDGLAVRDFTYVDTVVEAIEKALEYSANKSTICNVGTGQGTRITDLATMIGKTPTYQDARLGDIQCSIASTKLCEDTLDHYPWTSIQMGIELTKEFYAKEASG